VVALFSLLLQLTGKGEAVAFVLVTRLLPAFFVGPAAGVLADRVSRVSIMVVCDLLRFALVLCLLLVRRPEDVPIAYAVMAAHSLASAFFEPAQIATLPSLVPAEDLVYASTLENSLWSIALAIGASAGGVLVALLGRDAAFVCDALSFLGSALLLRGLPQRVARARREQLQELEEPRAQASGWVNLLGLPELREGFRYMGSHAFVRALLYAKAGFGLTLGGVLVLLAHFGEREFGHAGGSGIAALWTARGVGSLLGPLVAFRLAGTSPRSLRRGVLAAQLVILVSYLAFAAAPSLWGAAAALAVANAGGSILWTYGSTLLSQLVPDQVRGRVAAAEMGGMTLAMSASTLLTGHLLDAGTPARWLMLGCALVGLFPIAAWHFGSRGAGEAAKRDLDSPSAAAPH
jgi:predicted MFS family arabinose efflux permease